MFKLFTFYPIFRISGVFKNDTINAFWFIINLLSEAAVTNIRFKRLYLIVMGYAQKVVVKLETLRFNTRFFHTVREKQP